MKKSARSIKRTPKRSSSQQKLTLLAVMFLAIPITLGMVYTRTQLNSNAQTVPGEHQAFEKIDGKPVKVPGKVVIGYKKGAESEVSRKEQRVLDRLAQKNVRRQARLERRLERLQVSVITVSPTEEAGVIADLQADPEVAYAENDYYVYAAEFIPNDTEFRWQYALLNTGSQWYFTTSPTMRFNGIDDADIDAPAAWDKTRGLMSDGSPVKVAVLDTGIDPAHPELQGKIVAERNFTTTSSTDDFRGHGTHVAGIIAANTNNATGVAGVCPDCVIMNGKVLDDSGSGRHTDIAAGVNWAVDNGAQVINMSLGGTDRSNVLENAVNYAANNNVVVVAAAGNSGLNRLEYPAGYEATIAVASVDNNDQKSSFSNFGTWVEIAAHGRTVVSSMPTHPNNRNFPQNYAYLSGTSMAAPHVAGVAALVWTTEFGTSANAVRSRVLSTADRIEKTDEYWMNGRINAHSAVGPIPTQDPSVTPSVSNPPTTQNYQVSGEVFIDANKNDKRSKKERGFAGIRVSLNGPVNRSAVTVSGGRFSFENLEPGTYTVTISVPNRYRRTTVGTVTVTLDQTTTQKSVNFGIIRRN